VVCEKVTTHKGGPRHYYLCATQRTRGTCPGRGLKIYRETLESSILDAIERSLLTPERLADLVERAMRRQAAAAKAQPDRRAALERQLAEARTRVDRYVRAIGDGLDLEEVKAHLSEWKAKARALELELTGLGGDARLLFDRAAIAKRAADWRGSCAAGPCSRGRFSGSFCPVRVRLSCSPLRPAWRSARWFRGRVFLRGWRT